MFRALLPQLLQLHLLLPLLLTTLSLGLGLLLLAAQLGEPAAIPGASGFRRGSQWRPGTPLLELFGRWLGLLQLLPLLLSLLLLLLRSQVGE